MHPGISKCTAVKKNRELLPLLFCRNSTQTARAAPFLLFLFPGIASTKGTSISQKTFRKTKKYLGWQSLPPDEVKSTFGKERDWDGISPLSSRPLSSPWVYPTVLRALVSRCLGKEQEVEDRGQKNGGRKVRRQY